MRSKLKGSIIGLVLAVIVLTSFIVSSGTIGKGGKANEVNLDIEYTDNTRTNIQAFKLGYKVDTKEVRDFSFSIEEEKQLNFKYTSTLADSGIMIKIKDKKNKQINEFPISKTEGSHVQLLQAGKYKVEVAIPANTEGSIYISWKD